MARRTKDPEIPDSILPPQYFAAPELAATPEKRLMFAVLMDAVTQLQKGDTEGALDAERWIRGESGDVAISFPHACDALGLEPDGLADGLMSWRANARAVPRVRHRVAQFGRLRARRKAVAPGGSLRAGYPFARGVAQDSTLRERSRR